MPFIVSFGSFIDETSVLADLILPDHSFLESWVDSAPESGSLDAVTSVAGPVMKPLLPHARDGGRAARRRRQAEEAARPAVEDVRRDAEGVDRPLGDDAWTTRRSRAAGGASCRRSAAASAERRPKARRRRCSVAAAVRRRRRRSIRSTSCRTPSLQFFDGSLAHLPWLQELPDPMTSAMWSSWVEINPQTAARLQHRAGRHRRSRVVAGHAARAGVHLPGHRARHGRDAGRPGTRDVHALRERARRRTRSRSSRRSTEAGDRRAGLGGDARQDRARRRRRRTADPVRRRDARASETETR